MTPEQIEEAAHAQTIDQRDRMEAAFSQAYELVLGQPIEWSSAYHTQEALDDMEAHILAQQAEIDRLRAKVAKGDALAEAVRHEREPVVCQDYNMQTQAHEAVGLALTAYREAGQ